MPTNEQTQNQCQAVPFSVFANKVFNTPERPIIEKVEEYLKDTSELKTILEFFTGYTLAQDKDIKYKILESYRIKEKKENYQESHT